MPSKKMAPLSWDRLIERVQAVPDSEYSRHMIQAMIQAMGVSFYKYGAVADAYPAKVDAIGSLIQRLVKYAGFERIEKVLFDLRNNLTFSSKVKEDGDGNTEWLVDSNNFGMIEFMCPRHPKAHYKPTDSDASPGRVANLEVTARSNENIT